MIQIPSSRSDARLLDGKDPLAPASKHFRIPSGRIYLVGHSLGPQPAQSHHKVQAALNSWTSDLVGAWNSAGWIDLAERTGDRIAKLIGADPGSVIVADNVSVNLFKLTAAALSLCRKPLFLIEEDEFPTDQYIVAQLGAFRGIEVRRLPPGEGIAALSEGGILIKSAVNYRSSEVADIQAHETEARRSGALVVWDLSHATGVIDIALRTQGVMLATGCTYKYLNGGPGAPAFLYIAPEIAGKVCSPLPGWMGHKAPFAFESTYEPRDGAARFASGTPPILSLAALDGAIDVLSVYPVSGLQRKASSLGALAISRAEEIGLQVQSPYAHGKRGGHISLRMADGYPVVQALAARGILADFRAPDTVRMGFSPLFLSYVQVWDAMAALEEILTTRSWNRPEFQVRSRVT